MGIKEWRLGLKRPFKTLQGRGLYRTATTLPVLNDRLRPRCHSFIPLYKKWSEKAGKFFLSIFDENLRVIYKRNV